MDYRESLRNYIQNDLLANQAGVNIGYDDDLLLSGLLNSLSVMRLVSHIQERYRIEVPVEDVIIENFATVQALADYLKQRGI
ncbi:MAG: acyl carrier protein [Anaerolineae bacterium]|nr:acyl carrier protein [Anaerolineae bacterium]MCA9896155.1 acyl carrier protein [Anaerolineae bacterium]